MELGLRTTGLGWHVDVWVTIGESGVKRWAGPDRDSGNLTSGQNRDFLHRSKKPSDMRTFDGVQILSGKDHDGHSLGKRWRR